MPPWCFLRMGRVHTDIPWLSSSPNTAITCQVWCIAKSTRAWVASQPWTPHCTGYSTPKPWDTELHRGFHLSLNYRLILETAFQKILLFPLTSKGLFSHWWARVQLSFIQEIEQLHPIQGPPKHCTVIKSPTRSAWAKILSLCPENHKHLSPLLSKEKSVVTVNTVNVKNTHRGHGGSLSPK